MPEAVCTGDGLIERSSGCLELAITPVGVGGLVRGRTGSVATRENEETAPGVDVNTPADLDMVVW